MQATAPPNNVRYGGGMDDFDDVMSDAFDEFDARYDAGGAATP
jgi:hypothetical protein